jgi:chromosomal replication initiator protein
MQPSAEKIWTAAQTTLRGLLNNDIYSLWFAPVEAAAIEDDALVLRVANDFCELWLKDNYLGLIQDALSLASGRQMKVRFRVASPPILGQPPGEPFPFQAKESEPLPERSAAGREVLFNPNNTFDTFVVGNNNQFAHAAAVAVAQAPGKSYNPLFLYGGVGLGKTHLLHAIGHYVASHKKGARVAYVSSEKFTNEYIDAIQNSQLVRFRRKYRQTDVLLIDDIQFLAGKERMQEEFFHTFNSLRAAGKQIVLASDQAPRAISNLEERLQSRFESGLIAEIRPPEARLRLAILEHKAKVLRFELPLDVARWVAEKVVSSVRELEGALHRLIAACRWSQRALDLGMAKEILRPLLRPTPACTIEQVQRMVAESFRVTPDDLVRRGRASRLSVPRQVAMYLARKRTHATLAEIAAGFGGRDHSTVMYAVKQVEARRLADVEFATLVDGLAGKLASA